MLDSSSLLIKLEFRHTGFVDEAISILHRWQKKMILLPRKKLRTKMVMILLISALPIRSNSLTWLFLYTDIYNNYYCNILDQHAKVTLQSVCSFFFNKRFLNMISEKHRGTELNLRLCSHGIAFCGVTKIYRVYCEHLSDMWLSL